MLDSRIIPRATRTDGHDPVTPLLPPFARSTCVERMGWQADLCVAVTVGIGVGLALDWHVVSVARRLSMIGIGLNVEVEKKGSDRFRGSQAQG